MQKKNKKEQLKDVSPIECCDNCGFFKKNKFFMYSCLSVEANKRYDMSNLSKNKVCSYFTKDGYICSECGTTLKIVKLMYGIKAIIKPNEYTNLTWKAFSYRYFYCEKCIAEGIKKHMTEHDDENEAQIVMITL